MTKHKTVGLAVLSAAVLWLASPRADEVPASGLYQIISGTYSECCGIGGPFTHSLPEANQNYVQFFLLQSQSIKSLQAWLRDGCFHIICGGVTGFHFDIRNRSPQRRRQGTSKLDRCVLKLPWPGQDQAAVFQA